MVGAVVRVAAMKGTLAAEAVVSAVVVVVDDTAKVGVDAAVAMSRLVMVQLNNNKKEQSCRLKDAFAVYINQRMLQYLKFDYINFTHIQNVVAVLSLESTNFPEGFSESRLS